MTNKRELRKMILQRRGIKEIRRGRAEAKAAELGLGNPEWEVSSANRDITPDMRILEMRFKKPIEELIDPKRGGQTKLAREFGLERTTVYKWQKRLGLT